MLTNQPLIYFRTESNEWHVLVLEDAKKREHAVKALSNVLTLYDGNKDQDKPSQKRLNSMLDLFIKGIAPGHEHKVYEPLEDKVCLMFVSPNPVDKRLLEVSQKRH